MELRYSFDPEKFFLGKPCKHGHLWPGTQLTLRRLPRKYNGSPYALSPCVGCSATTSHWMRRFTDWALSGLPAGCKLGKLCSKGHEYEDTGLSLRLADGHCKECERIRISKKVTDPEKRKEYGRRYYEKNRELIRERDRTRSRSPERQESKSAGRKRKREELRAQGLTECGTPIIRPEQCRPQFSQAEREARAKRAETQRALRRIEAELWQAEMETPEYKEMKRVKNLANHHARYKSDPEFRLYHREKSKRRKAQIKACHAVRVRARDIRARFALFGGCCAYCGESGDMHMDHFVPLAQGGTHALGNLVPACPRCNFSKRDHDAESWYRQQPYFCEKRWRKILRVLGLKKCAPTQLTLL